MLFRPVFTILFFLRFFFFSLAVFRAVLFTRKVAVINGLWYLPIAVSSHLFRLIFLLSLMWATAKVSKVVSGVIVVNLALVAIYVVLHVGSVI
jgi:hypothetical protein